MQKFQDAAVKKIFDACPEAQRASMLKVRDLIFDVAKHTEGVGPIVETLKWGEPSYLTEETGAGSTVRIDRFGEKKIGVFFHCQTTLVDTFKGMFPDLEYSKNRAIVLDPEEELPVNELRLCIQTSLTYKLRKKK